VKAGASQWVAPLPGAAGLGVQPRLEVSDIPSGAPARRESRAPAEPVSPNLQVTY